MHGAFSVPSRFSNHAKDEALDLIIEAKVCFMTDSDLTRETHDTQRAWIVQHEYLFDACDKADRFHLVFEQKRGEIEYVIVTIPQGG